MFPLDLKSATGVDVGENADRSFLSFHVAIAAHPGQMAAGSQTETPSEYKDRDPFHVESHFYDYDAPTSRFGFNKNSRRSVSRARSGELVAFAEATAPE